MSQSVAHTTATHKQNMLHKMLKIKFLHKCNFLVSFYHLSDSDQRRLSDDVGQIAHSRDRHSHTNQKILKTLKLYIPVANSTSQFTYKDLKLLLLRIMCKLSLSLSLSSFKSYTLKVRRTQNPNKKLMGRTEASRT